MFSENTLMSYRQDLQLGPYFMQGQLPKDEALLHRFAINHFAK